MAELRSTIELETLDEEGVPTYVALLRNDRYRYEHFHPELRARVVEAIRRHPEVGGEIWFAPEAVLVVVETWLVERGREGEGREEIDTFGLG